MKTEPATTAGTDRDLAEAVLQLGDEQAFRELYRRHTPRLLGFVSRMLAGSASEEEDAVQDTWIRACESLERFEWRSTLSTWLLGIALNVVRDQFRRGGRAKTVPMESAPERPGPRAAHESRIDLERSIAMLPDDFRMVLVLHDVEGMKHREIAERLDVPVGTTKSQLFRARKMIRDRLSEQSE
jgi:RNA polymerase sigma-70 factor (ECF subfamily)